MLTVQHCTVRRVIAAVVVTFSTPAATLGRCLDAVAGEVDLVVVVDTGGSAEVEDRPGVVVLRVRNDGYGAAANAGFRVARAAGATTAILLNDDVVGRPGWVAPLVEALAKPGVGAAQPVLLVADTDPPVVNSLGARVGPDGAGVDVGDGERYVAGTGTSEIELFTGGAVAFSDAFLQATGGFDERWFLYYEDVDLGRRGAVMGWTYLLVHDSVVAHTRGESTSRQPERTRFLQERNRLWAAFRFADRATVGRAVWLSIRRLRYAPVGVHAKALAAGLAGAPRELWQRARR